MFHVEHRFSSISTIGFSYKSASTREDSGGVLMFHVEQFMIPNVKQLLPKLRRNVITSTISLLVPRLKCFTWNKHPISIPCKTPVRQLRNTDNISISTPFTPYTILLPNLRTRLANNKNKPHRSSSGRFNVFTVMNVIHFQTTWNKIKNVSRGT